MKVQLLKKIRKQLLMKYTDNGYSRPDLVIFNIKENKVLKNTNFTFGIPDIVFVLSQLKYNKLIKLYWKKKQLRTFNNIKPYKDDRRRN